MLPGSDSHHISDPSPSPSHDDCDHAVLVAEGEKMLAGVGLGPEYSMAGFFYGSWCGSLLRSLSFNHPLAF